MPSIKERIEELYGTKYGTRWATSSELEEDFGVSRFLVAKYTPILEEDGMAVKSRGKKGMWMFCPEAVEILAAQAGRVGRPRDTEKRRQIEWLLRRRRREDAKNIDPVMAMVVEAGMD